MKGSIKEHAPGVFHLIYDLGAHPVTGRRQQKWVTFRGTKRDAQKELNRLLVERENNGVTADPKRLTLGDFLDRWLELYVEKNVAPRTRERYAEIVNAHLKPALGRVILTRLAPLQIQEYYHQAQATGRRDGKGGLSAQTVIHHHRVLRLALKHALKWQILSRNPADAVEAPSVKQRKPTVLPAEGLVRLFQAAEGTRLHLPVMIAAYTGLRLGEVLALQWPAVDLERGTLSVLKTLEETRGANGERALRLKEPKTHRSERPVKMPRLLIDELRAHRARQAQHQLLCGDAYENHQLVVAQEFGQPWPVRTISKAFEHLAQQAGCPEIRFHDLRHSHVSELLAAGVPLPAISARVGHARKSTTLDLYGHLMPGQDEETAQVVDSIFERAFETASKPSLRVA